MKHSVVTGYTVIAFQDVTLCLQMSKNLPTNATPASLKDTPVNVCNVYGSSFMHSLVEQEWPNCLPPEAVIYLQVVGSLLPGERIILPESLALKLDSLTSILFITQRFTSTSMLRHMEIVYLSDSEGLVLADQKSTHLGTWNVLL